MSTPASKRCKSALAKHANAEKAKILSSFFKTGKGEYGEGDIFLGIPLPDLRRIVKEQIKEEGGWSFETIDDLIQDPIHDHRMAGWSGLVHKFEKSNQEGKKECFDFASARLHRANNWDLVDTVMPKIIGEYLRDKDRGCLFEWAKSDCLWVQRTAMVCTWTFMKYKDSSTTLALAEELLHHPHDLMHKAVGWMLRESAKRVSRLEVTKFVAKYKDVMPRTALRYAIERYPREERDWFMGRTTVEPAGLWEEGLC